MSDTGQQHRLREPLLQMVAVLQAERHALAALDLDGMLAAAADKRALCDAIDHDGGRREEGGALDEECEALLDTARRLNEINRQVRNLVAANVAARLDALVGGPALYRAGPRPSAAYGYAGAHA